MVGPRPPEQVPGMFQVGWAGAIPRARRWTILLKMRRREAISRRLGATPSEPVLAAGMPYTGPVPRA